jgi:hypothetical protein
MKIEYAIFLFHGIGSALLRSMIAALGDGQENRKIVK